MSAVLGEQSTLGLDEGAVQARRRQASLGQAGKEGLSGLVLALEGVGLAGGEN